MEFLYFFRFSKTKYPDSVTHKPGVAQRKPFKTTFGAEDRRLCRCLVGMKETSLATTSTPFEAASDPTSFVIFYVIIPLAFFNPYEHR
jgi:hypothetical protein